MKTKILIPAGGTEDWKAFFAEPDKQWRRGYRAWYPPVSRLGARGQEIPEFLTAGRPLDVNVLNIVRMLAEMAG